MWTNHQLIYHLVKAHSLSSMDNSIHTRNHPDSTGNNPDTNSIGHHQHIGPNNGKHHQNGASATTAYQNRCSQGWMWYNNKCWLATQSRRDFAHAVDFCKKAHNSSTLPTIHSAEENEFLRSRIDLKNSPIWIYAKHNHQYNKTRWLDKSQVDFTNWDQGQPSEKSSLICIRTEDNWYMKKAESSDGQTECVSFWEDAKWGTQVGCTVLLPVVCEKKLAPMPRYVLTPNNSELVEQAPMVNSANSNLNLSKISAFNIRIFLPLSSILATFSTYLISNLVS